ncbi:MAG: hypothetical protein FWF73_07170 [Spirochaetes bacterium]|nr:hypothetical protein [Spirochaetota bacterium]
MVFSFVLISCSDDSDDPTVSTVPTTIGELTITGLGSHNTKYVAGIGFEDANKDKAYAAFASIDRWYLKDTKIIDGTGGQVESGSVTLKVWVSINGNLQSYSGNNNVVFSIHAKTNPSFDEDDFANSSGLKIGTVTVTFVNGVATGSLVP